VRHVSCALAAALVVAAAAGCAGGDDDAGATTAAPPATTTAPRATTSEQPATTDTDVRPEPPDDQSRWAREVDAACRPWQERLDAVAPPADEADLERWLDATLPLVRKQVAAVAAVQLPAARSEAEPGSRFVEDLRRVERGLTRYRAALRAGEPEPAQGALAEAGAAGAASRAAALALGVTACGGYSG
jgi:hypothetical protein